MPHLDRAGNCVCDECFEEDCADIQAAIPFWTRQRLEWIRHVRRLPLNWNIEPGHCVLCGGTDMNVSKQGDHWLVRNYNPVQMGDVLYTSVLVADNGSWSATFKYISQRGKEALKTWALNMVGASHLEKVYGLPAPPCGYNMKETTDIAGIAVRKVEHWTEIRIGIRERAA